MRRSTGEAEELRAARAGDEDAFLALVERHEPVLLRVAEGWLGSRALAEELVQDAWLRVMERLDSFEGRGSFRSWLLAIVSNGARTWAVREARTTSLAELEAMTSAGPSVDPSRFDAIGDWARPPRPLEGETPERLLRKAQAARALETALAALPSGQRAVVMLRDVDGLSAEEACEALALSAANQRVLLHRARSKLRALLEGFADGL